mmetsp:Transcript_31862/g.39142  ORF Transcript_31862/g.39142 Transcript_31862/m.39142 type:complete len:139 (-) Transcript_31862:118-534(-)
MAKNGQNISKKICGLLKKSNTDLFVRPECSDILLNNFDKRCNISLNNNDTQWLHDFIILRELIDDNQNLLKKMDRLRPPKNERTVMEAISRRVGLEMPKPLNYDNTNNDLQYLFEKFYVPFNQFNKPKPINDDDINHE